MSNTVNDIANDTANKPQREELGALWKRQGKNQTYLTGYINKANGEKTKIVVFSSKNKKSENQPDFRIYESIPMDGRPTTNATPQKSAAKTSNIPSTPKSQLSKTPAQQDDDDGLL
jgi:hypothetical protein